MVAFSMRKIITLFIITFIGLLVSSLYPSDAFVPTATPTSVDLQNTELLTVVQELLRPDEDCQLPCFWGFIPGVSSVSEVQDFWMTTFEIPLETTLSDDGRIFASFWADFVPQNTNTDIFVTMTFRDDVLWLFNITMFDISIWLGDDWLSPPDVLQELPDGTEIFIGVRLPGGPSTVSLTLVNTEANIMIRKVYQLHISGNIISPDSTEPLLLCPTENNLIYSSLWILDDETPISIEEVLGNPTFPGSELAVYQPIEFMTNLSSDEFSEFIHENPDDCVEMLSYSELLDLGYSF